MMLLRTMAERALPFEHRMANAETVEAMKAVQRVELVTVGNIVKLFADPHAEKRS
jgi:antitoxin component of RelBE/YafQ-DinJ toxin-antitoxin module